MNHRLLLVKCITLLYRESQLPGVHENSAALVRSILCHIKDPQSSIGLDHERDIVIALKKTALGMCEAPPDHEYETIEILQQLKVDCSDDEKLYESLAEGIEKELTENRIRKTALNLRRALHEFFREERITEVVFKASNKLRFNRDEVTNIKQFAAEVCAELEPYQVDAGTKDPAIVTEVDLAKIDEVKHVFMEIQKNENGNGILKTGWQGINRMLRGGFRRGQQTVIAALQSNFKTGFSLAAFIGVALFNTPEMIDPARKPLLLRISFEDDLELNFQYMYEVLMSEDGREAEITKKTKADFDAMTDDELDAYIAPIAAYVMERMRAGGYEVRMLRVNPSEWTYRDLCNKILELEAEGYEIHLCMVDYLSMMPTTGCLVGPAGTDLRDMYRRIRNFCAPRKIAFVTPHQLSTDAKQMIRDGRADFVKELVGKGYYSGSKQIDQEVDLEIFIHIEISNNVSYLTVQRGKHRIIGQTSPKYRYCVLLFSEYGIRFDINGADTTRRKVGGGPIGSAEETPFWDFKAG